MSIALLDDLLFKARGILGAKFRLRDIEVEEVSLVDRAANRRKFLVIKRGTHMESAIEKIEEQASPTVLQSLADGLVKLVEIVTSVKAAVEADASVENNALDATVVEAVKGVVATLLSVVPQEAAKAEGMLSRTLREVSEVAMSLAQSVAESEELKPEDLEGVKNIAGKLMAVIEQYPSPVTQAVEEEKALEAQPESPLEEAPLVVADEAPVQLSNLGTETADKLSVLGLAMQRIAEADSPESLTALKTQILGVAKALVEIKTSTDVVADIAKIESMLKEGVTKSEAPATDVLKATPTAEDRLAILEEKLAKFLATPQVPASRQEQVQTQRPKATTRRNGGPWAL